MLKNIVVFSDGTGQEGGKGFNTNVYKLFNMVEDRTERQIAFYDRGLGTGWRKFTGSAFGAGISKNVKECYEFVFENFKAGDQIYLFGFSRGAFTVRSVAGFINLFGILPKSRPELIDVAYKIYKAAPDKRERKANAFLAKHHTMKCNIKLIGVWDTVAALGIPNRTLDLLNPFKHTFHDATLSSNVENGLHALAIDDERKVFHPTVWDEDNISEGQEIKQVWFSGMHTDVGGGYKKDGLSDITLDWMMRNAEAKGLWIYPHHRVQINPDPNGFMHDSRKGFPGRHFSKKVRSIDPEKIRRIVIHQSVLQRIPDRFNNPDKEYRPWILDLEHEIEQ